MLSRQERDDVIIAIQMRLSYIETGNPTLRAADIKAGHKGQVNALSTDQMRTILRLEDALIKLTGSGDFL